ncbi:MAG: hypothetical protein WC635_02240 [Bacteriovorax sp.]
MIHNNSTDPVLIKKISLKIWSLRDEIEARIQLKIDGGGPVAEEDILKIRELYTPKSATPDNVLSLKPNAELPTDEDEMARAMAEEEVPGEEAPPVDGEDPALENVVELAGGAIPADEATHISISLDAPHIDDDKIAKGKTVLSEISMNKMFFFCNKPFTEGQSIVIQFCIPKSFIVNADILYCRPFNLKSRIISQNNYTHRALIRFNFLKEGERGLLRQFLQSIEPEVVKVEKKAAATNDKDGGSDFNDLDDLGL